MNFEAPKALWRQFLGDSPNSSGIVVVYRVAQVFADHGVSPAQVTRLLPQINLVDFKSAESLLAVLDPKLLDEIANLFAKRREWLDGEGDEIYEYRSCYKDPESFFE